MASVMRGSAVLRRTVGVWIYCFALTLHAQSRLPLPDWHELTLELPPALMVRAELEATASERIKPHLVSRSQALEPPPQSTAYHLTVETRLKWFLSSKTWLGQLWLQPDLTALQRTRLKSGPSGNYKIYRYAVKGVYRIRRQPKSPDQALAPPQTWPVTNEAFHPFPGAALRRCAFISDPYAILLLLSRDWPAAETTVCLFNKQGVYQVTFRPDGLQSVQADYRRLDTKARQIRTRTQVERILIHPVPLESGAATGMEPFEFLGMEGDIVFLRDPVTHLPLQIEGEVPGFGQAKLRLTRVRMRSP